MFDIKEVNLLIVQFDYKFNIYFSNPNLRELSCTDTACAWSQKKYEVAVEKDELVVLVQHSCFSETPPVHEGNLRSLISKRRPLADATKGPAG